MCVFVLFLPFLQAANWLTLTDASQTTISIYPGSLIIPPGSTITAAVTVAEVTNLYDWQVGLKYSASVINCSAAWIPDNNVFEGHTFVAPEPLVNGPTTDGLNYLLIGASLIGDDSGVNVPSGTLFNLNLTAVGNGETSILIGTKQNPIASADAFVQFSGGWYSFLLDPNLNDMPFAAEGGVASVTGGVNVTVGVNVKVSPTNDLELTFANVTAAGYATANKTSTVQAPLLANVVGQYYDIRVTASYTGNVTVSLTYNDSNMTQQQESNLQMMHYTPMPGDISPPFGSVDMRDIGGAARAFGTKPNDTRWDKNADINGDGKVDMKDIGLVAKNFGKIAQWINITTRVDTTNNVIYGETTHFSLIGIH